MSSYQQIVVVPTKSAGVAFILGLLFGPLGLFYASVTGAIVMIVVYIAVIVIGVVTFGIGLLLLIPMHPVCAIWGMVAANSHNRKLLGNAGDAGEEPQIAHTSSGSVLSLSIAPPVETVPAAVPEPADQASGPAFQPAASICVQCGHDLIPGKRFCGQCGHAVNQFQPQDQFAATGAAAAPTPAPLPELEPAAPPVQAPLAAAPDAAEVQSKSCPCARQPDAQAEEIQQLLFDAARLGDMETVKELLASSKCLVFCRDEEGWTALHWAASRGHEAVVEFLLASGAKAGARASGKRTPLHFAAFKGYKSIVERLLAYGADANAETRDGETPLHVARMGGHPEVEAMLRDYAF